MKRAGLCVALTIFFAPLSPVFAADCPMAYFSTWSVDYNGGVLCFVGTNPTNGPGLTTITMPIIPIKLRYLGKNGDVVSTSDPTAPLPGNPKLSALESVLASPIFVAQDFKFGNTSVGTAQWIEAAERASFWNYPGVRFDNWHITLFPLSSPSQSLDVPNGDWSADSASPQITVVTKSVIDNFIQGAIDSGSYAGTVPIFLVYNAVETGGTGGYHRTSSAKGFENPYIFAGYADPPYRVTGVHALSHEVAEFAHDPFVGNIAPWPKQAKKLPWKPPYVFTEADCQDTLEVGDPVEDLSASDRDVNIGTYQFANLALASWFMQANPSFSVNNWYTLKGAVDGAYASPAPACPSNGLPYLDTISPASGSMAGGTKVTVKGVSLSKNLTFDFGGAPATKVACTNSSQCTMLTPAHKYGPVDVIVKSSTGDSGPVPFTYWYPSITGITPAMGPLEGGTKVTVTGEYLSAKYPFEFGGTPATKVVCSSTTTCTMLTPFHNPGSVEVVARTSDGDFGLLTYNYLAPSIDSFSPAVGPTTGGLSVVITGTSLSDKMIVKFGAAEGKNPSCGGYTTNCTVISPPGMAGMAPVPLTITLDGITSDPTTKTFSFAVFPTFTSIFPGSGPTGTIITLTGTGFSTAPGGTTVTFDGVPAPASEVTCSSTTTCKVRFPGSTVTNVDVQVTVDGHTALQDWIFVDTDKPKPPPTI